MIRRVGVQLLIATLFGVATTVLVAWVIAARNAVLVPPHPHNQNHGFSRWNLTSQGWRFDPWLDERIRSSSQESERQYGTVIAAIQDEELTVHEAHWEASHWRGSGYATCESTVKIGDFFSYTWWGDSYAAEVVPSWASSELVQDAPAGEHHRFVCATGWPLLTLRATAEVGSRNGVAQLAAVESGVVYETRGGSSTYGETTRVIPFAPIWPNFAVSVLLYAAALWLLMASFTALRRRVRLQRNHCTKCGYPVGNTSYCSECGASVPERRAP